MQVSVFGLGYVGLVTAACLAQDGHKVIGVDVVPAKVDLISQGRSPIVEKEINEIVQATVNSGRLEATTSARQALAGSDMAIVCVGTPSLPNGAIDTRHIEAVAAEIGDSIRTRVKPEPFLFVLRSTVIPGTLRSLVIPIMETHARLRVGHGFEVLSFPEFLREGTSIQDYYNPPKIVVGERVPGSGQQVFDLYSEIEAPRFATSIETAEAVKCTDNAFHAIKVTFANEIGQFCLAHAIDSREVMDIVCADTKLNISPKYLRPGFAFGGSCLPKDLRALLQAARYKDLSLPMLENVLPSNKAQIERVVGLVLEPGAHGVGMVGLSFKPGTDDLRESPFVELAERLIGKGVEVRVYDADVNLSRLIGKNKEFLEKRLPHISRTLVSSLDELSDSDAVVIGHPVNSHYLVDWLERGKTVIDLVGLGNESTHQKYFGVAW